MKDKVFHIKAVLSLDGMIKGRPYRTIAVSANDSLNDLAYSIVNSFDFDFDHCFGFYNNFKDSYRSTEGYELFADLGEQSLFPGVKETGIYKAYNEIDKKLLFLYDFGDNWEFITQLIRIEDFKTGEKYPKVIDSVGESPEQYPGYEDDDEYEFEDDEDEEYEDEKEFEVE